MKKIELILPALALIGLGTLCSYSGAGKENGKTEMQDLKGWPEVSVMAAEFMKDKYGDPDEATDHMLIWYNNGPWKKSIVYKHESKHDFPISHKDVLEQFIDYDVPADKFDELAEYDGSVYARRTDGTLSAKCDKEAANLLALNLANDVITGKKSVSDARTFYANTIKEFALEGKKSSYMKEFQFTVAKGRTGDSDKNAVTAEEHKKIMDAMNKMKEKKKEEMKKMKNEKKEEKKDTK